MSEVVRACAAKLDGVVDPAEAEDAAQEAALRALAEASVAPGRGPISERLWRWAREECYRTVRLAPRHQPRGHPSVRPPTAWEAVRPGSLRRGEQDPAGGRLRAPVDASGSAEETVVDAMAAAFLLSRMTRDERPVVVRRAEGLSNAEIGAELGRSESWVEQVMVGARKRLGHFRQGVQAGLIGWCARRRWTERASRAAATGGCTVAVVPMAQLVVAIMVAGMGAAPATADTWPSNGVPGVARMAAHEEVAGKAGTPGVATPRRSAPRWVPAPAAEASAGPGGLDSVRRITDASGETPEDAQLVDAEPAPGFAHNRTIVALGYGAGCQCSVLFRSVDGGGSWAATRAPSLVDQVVLPPGYPQQDGRIFLGSPVSGAGLDYVAESFGGRIVALASLAGHLALSGGFGHGDDRVFIATRGALMTVDMRTRRPAVALAYPGSSDVARVATAASEPESAVVVTIPPGVSAGALSTATGLPAPGLYVCSAAAATGCELRVADVYDPATVLATPPPDNGDLAAVVIRGDGRGEVSLDGGRTFSAFALPSGMTRAASVAVGGGRVWTVLASNAGAYRTEWMSEKGGGWHDVSAADPLLARSGVVIPVDELVVLDLAHGGSLRCSVDGGGSWAPRCGVGQLSG
jgi:DNA-directed RNA polymerase specialized sigma24 family protein